MLKDLKNLIEKTKSYNKKLFVIDCLEMEGDLLVRYFLGEKLPLNTTKKHYKN